MRQSPQRYRFPRCALHGFRCLLRVPVHPLRRRLVLPSPQRQPLSPADFGPPVPRRHSRPRWQYSYLSKPGTLPVQCPFRFPRWDRVLSGTCLPADRTGRRHIQVLQGRRRPPSPLPPASPSARWAARNGEEGGVEGERRWGGRSRQSRVDMSGARFTPRICTLVVASCFLFVEIHQTNKC